MENKTYVTPMQPKNRQNWHAADKRRKKRYTKRLARNTSILAAVLLCLCGVGVAALHQPEKVSAVLSHVDSGFEFDETLGRLQFVSNILPQSAMVFLTSMGEELAVFAPVDAAPSHAWSQDEPWLEYGEAGKMTACQDGEVMTIVKNRLDEYTVRVMHSNGYESLYSGINALGVSEGESVRKGQPLGTIRHTAAFELRKDGVSILPDFSSR